MQDENKNLNGVGLIRIILEWAVAPPIAGVMAFCFFAFLKIAVLRKENAEKRMLIFLPICYGILAGLLCLFLMDQVHHGKPIPSKTFFFFFFTTGAYLVRLSFAKKCNFSCCLKRIMFIFFVLY